MGAVLIARLSRWSRIQISKPFWKARLRAWTPLRVEERLQSTDIDRHARIVSDRSGLRGCSASMEWSVSSTAAAVQFQFGLYRKSNLSRLACAISQIMEPLTILAHRTGRWRADSRAFLIQYRRLRQGQRS